MCVKCGRLVEPQKTNLADFDLPQKIYPHLIRYFGPVWGVVVAVTMFLMFLALFVGLIAIKLM
jgi:hypothetical protein